MSIGYSKYHLKSVLRYYRFVFDAYSLGVVWILSVTISMTCFGCRPQPPDVSTCTHVEFHYLKGALNHFFPDTAFQDEMLSEAERACVRAYDTWTVTDQQQIKALASQISQGTYQRKQRGATTGGIDVTCYRDSKSIASFTIYRTSIVSDDYSEFKYPLGSLDLTILDPPEVKSLKIRWGCAMNLSRLRSENRVGREDGPLPDPNRWCDVMVAVLRSHYVIRADLSDKRERAYPDTIIARGFTCPGTHPPSDVDDAHSRPDEADSSSHIPDSWMSDYAMNSNCKEGSPEDMVFLFESQPGWNQHGGPELFAFDNHDPKGGCVLLNDGTVKFIRTQEELDALRWE